jgi:hypothetical protein
MIEEYKRNGYILAKSFFSKEEVEQVRQDAKNVFIAQMKELGIIQSNNGSEVEFESAMMHYFKRDTSGIINRGKTCQHLIKLHTLCCGFRWSMLMSSWGRLKLFPAVMCKVCKIRRRMSGSAKLRMADALFFSSFGQQRHGVDSLVVSFSIQLI